MIVSLPQEVSGIILENIITWDLKWRLENSVVCSQGPHPVKRPPYPAPCQPNQFNIHQNSHYVQHCARHLIPLHIFLLKPPLQSFLSGFRRKSSRCWFWSKGSFPWTQLSWSFLVCLAQSSANWVALAPMGLIASLVTRPSVPNIANLTCTPNAPPRIPQLLPLEVFQEQKCQGLHISIAKWPRGGTQKHSFLRYLHTLA